MTGLLLDTNVVSELRKSSDRMNPGVRAWAANLDSTTAYLSAITISELSQWVVATQRRDPAQGDLLDRWFHSKVLSHYKEHIIPVDTAVALVAGSLHVPNPRDYRDCFIAASAIVHRLTVVTRNTHDFAPMTSDLINPFTP